MRTALVYGTTSQREHRVMDKALDFHADDPGSIPVGGEEVGCGIYSLNQ